MRGFTFLKLKRLVKKAYHRLFSCETPHPEVIHHTYDARELFFQENRAEGFNRYDIIVRLLAVENWHGQNDFGFALYWKMQQSRKAGDYQNAVTRFKELIESYEKHGYDAQSEIMLDCNLHLIDGSHRMALALYYKYWNISCAVMPYELEVKYGMKTFVEYGFTRQEIALIQSRYEALKNEIHVPFVCTLWSPAAPYFDEIIERLSLVCEIIDFHDFVFDEFNYAQMVRKIYSVDDIEKWKIEKKLEHMHPDEQSGAWPMRVVRLKMDKPRFRRKGSTQNTLSMEGEDLKRMMRNGFKEKVDDYFYDTIIHIGDNYRQNEFISYLLEFQCLRVDKVLASLSAFQYVLSKTAVPYMPCDFPATFPIGKDIDIICLKSDFDAVITTISGTLYDMGLPYVVRKVEKSRYAIQLRVECENQLVFLFDVMAAYEWDGDDFVQSMIEGRIPKDSYYIPEISYELLIRLHEILKNPKKQHHIGFVKEHWHQMDSSIAEKYLTLEAKKVWEEILESAYKCDMEC